MPNTTALSGLVLASATTGQTNLNGNYIWICVGGYVSGVIGAASMAAGASVYGSSTNFVPGYIATGSAPLQRVLGIALSAVGVTPQYLFNILVTLES